MNKNSKVAYHSIIPQRVIQTLLNLVPCVQYGNLADTQVHLFSILPTPFSTGLTQCIVFQMRGFCDFEVFRRTLPFSSLSGSGSIRQWGVFSVIIIFKWWSVFSHTLVSNNLVFFSVKTMMLIIRGLNFGGNFVSEKMHCISVPERV